MDSTPTDVTIDFFYEKRRNPALKWIALLRAARRRQESL